MDWNDLRVSSTVHLSNNSVINLFKLSREFPRDLHHKLVDKHLHNHLDGKIWDKLSDEHWDKLDGKSLDYGRIFESEFLNSAFVNFHKDLQLWDRDKLTVIDIITKRLRTSLHSTQSNLPPNTSAPGPNNYRDPRSLPDPRNDMNGRTVPHVRSGDEELVMDLESELLISWLDRYVSDISNISSGSKIFMENAVKLLKKVDLAPVNLLNFMFSLVKLAAAKPQNFFHKYLKLSLAQLEKQAFSNLHYYILNTRQLFLNDLILNTELTPAETLKLVFQTANTFYASDGGINGFNTGKLPDYYFFILYLLFRSGSHSSISLLLTYLEKNSGISGTRDIEGFSMSLHEVPPLFTDLCRVLLNILLEKCDNTDLLPQFLSKYPQSGATRVDNTNPLVNYGTGVNPMTVNTVNIWLEMLLSIVFPDNYVECDVSVLTREDYIWYKLRLMLNSGSLVVRSYELCKSLTQESINATDKDLFDRIVSYAYCMALSGGVMESLRLLMSAVKVPQVQSIAMVFTVLGENCGLFDFEEVNFVSYALWNFVDQNNKLVKSHNTEELSYLLLLAFNRNRNVSTELKVLLSTVRTEFSYLTLKYVNLPLNS
eukprot:XP_764976.1 hypothetical protein [Theileria parva strain Muguga]